jgi:hypothetical protein
MTVAELIAELQKQNPEATVSMSIGDPKDTAYTDDVSVRATEDGVKIDGWVSSDNEEAFAPWGREHDG